MNPTAPRRGFGATDGRRTRPARCAGRGPPAPRRPRRCSRRRMSKRAINQRHIRQPSATLPGRVWRHALRLMTPAVPARANGAGNGAQRAARAGGVPSEGGGRARWDGAKVGVSERVKPKRVPTRAYIIPSPCILRHLCQGPGPSSARNCQSTAPTGAVASLASVLYTITV